MKAIDDHLDLDEGACVFGAKVLLKHQKSLAEEVEGLQSGGEGIEWIHRARVASRRLCATLPLFKDCLPRKKSKAWLKQIRKVTKKLGQARDSDVQIEVLEGFQAALTDDPYRPGVERLLLRKRQQREQLQQPVMDAMDHLVDSQTLDEMKDYLDPLADREDSVYLYTPTLYQHSFHAIQQRLDDFLSFETVVPHPEMAHELHQMRIAAKWLRYTLETFAPLYASELKVFIDSIKEVQDLLGELHDCDVWLETLPQFETDERQRTLDYFGSDEVMRSLEPGLQYFRADRQRKRDKSYEAFTARWQQWKDKGLWEKLHRAIQIPFPQPEDIYPPLSSQSGEKTSDEQ